MLCICYYDRGYKKIFFRFWHMTLNPRANLCCGKFRACKRQPAVTDINAINSEICLHCLTIKLLYILFKA